MCGGKTTSQTDSSNSYSPPPDVLANYEAATQTAQNVASTPYNPYGGSLVAGINGQQSNGITDVNATNAIQNSYNAAASGNLGQAASAIGTGQTALGQAASYDQQGAGAIDPTQFSAAQVGQYESPYQSDVVNATMAEINNQNEQQASNLTGNAVSAGAFGGDRAGVAQAQLAGQQDLASNSTLANLNNQNYEQALGEFNTEQGVDLGAAQNTAARQLQAGQQLNSTALGYGTLGSELTATGQAQAGLGQAAQSEGLGYANAEINAGTLEQQTQQARDTANYNQFLQAQAYPFQTTGWLSNIVEGIGSQSGGSSTGESTTQGSAASAVAGGLLGLGSFLKRGGRVGMAIGGGLGGTALDGSLYDPTGYAPGIGYGAGDYVPPPSMQIGHTMPTSSSSGVPQASAAAAQPSMAQIAKGVQGLGNAFENSSLGDSFNDAIQDAGDDIGGDISSGLGGIGMMARGGRMSGLSGAIYRRGGPVVGDGGLMFRRHFDTGGATSGAPAPGATFIPGNGFGTGRPGNAAQGWSVPTSGGGSMFVPAGQFTPGAGGGGGTSGPTPLAPVNSNVASYSVLPVAMSDGSYSTTQNLGGIAATNALAASTINPSAAAAPITTGSIPYARGGMIRRPRFDDGGDVSTYGDLSGVPDSIAANIVPDANTTAAQIAAAYANQMPQPTAPAPADNSGIAAAIDYAHAPSGLSSAGAANTFNPAGAYMPGGIDANLQDIIARKSLGDAMANPSGVDPSQYTNQMPAPTGLGTVTQPQNVPADVARGNALLGPQPVVNPLPAGPFGGASVGAVQTDAQGNAIDPGTGRPTGLGQAYAATGPSAGVAPPVPPANVPSGGFLHALQSFESSNSNIPNTHQTTSSGQAQGYNQITTGTWRDFAPKAGVDLGKYPNALSAPEDVQNQVASIIPMNRWDPKTLAYLKDQGYSVDPTKTLGDNIAANDGVAGTANALAYDSNTGRGGQATGLAAAPAVQAINNASPAGSGGLGNASQGAPASNPQVSLPQFPQTAGPPTAERSGLLGLNLSPQTRQMMLQMGLGIMGGTSRDPWVNIGQGAASGIAASNLLNNTQSEIALRAAQTQGAQTENQMKSMQLKMMTDYLQKNAQGNNRAANAAASTPEAPASVTAPTVAGSPNGGVAPIDPLNPTPESQQTPLPQAAAARAAPIPADQNPTALRAQAAQLQQQAAQTALFNPQMSERLQANAQQLLNQANEINRTGRISAPDGKGGFTITNAPGFNQAEAATAGAKTSAEEAAKAPYEMVQVQPEPGGPTQLVPKSQLLNMQKSNPDAAVVNPGAGSPPGSTLDHVAAANPIVTKQPEFYAEKQKAIATEEQSMLDQYRQRQIVEQRLQTLTGIMQKYQPGAFAEQKADIVGSLRGIGIPVKDSDTANPAAFEEMMKNTQANVFDQAKALGGRILVTELSGLGKSNANPGMQPEANAAILGQALGLTKYEDKHTEDYFNWKQQNPNATSTAPFELNWAKNNPVGPFVAQATKGIAYKGQDVPAAPQRVVGQSYMTPKGPMVWQGTGWQMAPSQ